MIYDYGAEQAIIASVLDDNDLLKKSDVSLDLFNLDLHKRMWREIEELYKKNNTVDPTMLSDLVEAVEMMNIFYVSSNYNIYRQKLIEAKQKREFFNIVNEIKAELSCEGATAIDIKTKFLRKINNVEIEKTGKKYNLIDAIMKTSEILEKRYNGNEVYYKWGLDILDKATGGVMPTYSILSARPSTGKTALSLQLGLNVAKQGGSVAFFSLETNQNQIVTRMIANQGNIRKERMDNIDHIKDLDWAEYGRTAGHMSDLKFNIYDDIGDIETILLRAEEQRAEMGLDLLILDYIQLTGTKQRTNTPNEKVAYVSRELKLYQQRTGVHVLALSQFNRESVKADMPDMSHLRDSGSLEQDARIIMFLSEDKKTEQEIEEEIRSGKKEIVFRIAKNSEGESKVGRKLQFYGATQKFYE